MSNRGFSLIEMLTVIGIVGVLAGMSLPAITKARNNARFVQCMANQRNLAVSNTAAAYEYFPEGTVPNKITKAESEEFGKLVLKGYTGRIHLDKSLGQYNVYRMDLWNCPDTKEDLVTSPFSMYYGWMLEGENRGKNLTLNYQVFPSSLAHNDPSLKADSTFVEDPNWGVGENFPWSVPYNSAGNRFNVTFKDYMLHAYKGRGTVKTFGDMSIRWVPQKEKSQKED